jgi:hypothetical protein
MARLIIPLDDWHTGSEQRIEVGSALKERLKLM